MKLMTPQTLKGQLERLIHHEKQIRQWLHEVEKVALFQLSSLLINLITVRRLG